MNWTSRKIWTCILVLTMSATVHAEQLMFTTGDWRPYIFEENGTVSSTMSGFSVEIVNAVFDNLGYDIVYVTLPFLRQIQEVEKGKFTALVGVYSEEAPNLIFPQEPIGMTQNCFYTKSGHTWQYENLEDLSSAKIATASGYTYGEIDIYIKANDKRVMRLTGSEASMMKRMTQLVDIDRVTAFVQDVTVAEYFFKVEGLKGRYQKAGCLPCIETMIGFSPNDPRTPAFIQAFDIEIAKLRSSGKLEKILTKYEIADWK
jgi:polar amino acid transport system substrate-binding protein